VPATLTRAEESSAVWAARLKLALGGSFAALLWFVAIEDVGGKAESLPWLPPDSPEQTGSIRFRRWAYLIERAASWAMGRNEVVLKARQLGFTWLAAAYAYHVARRPGARVLIISKGKLEAYAFLDRVRFIHSRLPLLLQSTMEVDRAGEIRFKNGGQILALPSTRNAGRGFTGSLLIFDENAYHAWAAANWKAARATVADVGQVIVMSTANGASGFFHDMYRLAERNRERMAQLQRALAFAQDTHRDEEAAALERQMGQLGRVMLWPAFVSALERPDRTAEWMDAERDMYPGMPEEFASEYPMSVHEAFVRLSGLVYPQFNPELHVRETKPVPWEQCLYRYAGYDLGGGDPTAVVIVGAWRSVDGQVRLHQYAEYYRKHGAASVDELYEFMEPWHTRAPFTSIQGDPAPGGETVMESLRHLFGYGTVIQRGESERKAGLGTVAMFLNRGWLTLDQECFESIHEFAGYRWAQKVDSNSKDRYATGTPFDHHADAMDARRLVVLRFFRDVMEHRESVYAFEEVKL